MEDDAERASDNEEQFGEQDDDEGVGVAASKGLTQDLDGKKKKKKKKPLPPIRINLSGCKYEVLRIVQRKFGWREVGDEEDWEIYWTDTSVSIERVMKLSRTQKLNHFSGMLELCRKKSMARNLQKIQRVFPQHYDFFPKTFILPGDMQELVTDLKARGKKQIYILKPDAGCQGRGIRLLQGGKEETLQKTLAEMNTLNAVAQHYLPRPFLVHGYKFDLRIYALVLACDPLRVFVYREGLARICTEKYTKPKASNLNISYIHLTNYAVNKHNEHFVANQGSSEDAENASKLGLGQLAEYIQQQGHDWEQVWQAIQQLIVKTLISVQPILKNNYRSATSIDNDGFSCFEVLGYDIMLDQELRPWLIECNHSSSFNIDSPLDLAIKEALITDTLQLVRVDPKLIMKAKRMEKRSAAERLLEPMHRKKTTPGLGSDATGGAGGVAGVVSSPARAAAGAGAGAGGGTSASGAAARDADGDTDSDMPFRPKTAEDLEAWRAEIIRKREKYEESNLGGYTRIFPSPDPELQALYEELLKGVTDMYSSAFAKKKPVDALSEADRKRKEESESESVRAERARAKALRDKLAQQAVERRKLKSQFQASQQAMAAAQGSSQGSAAAYAGSLYGQSPAYVGVAGSEWGGYGHLFGGGGLMTPPAGTPPTPMVVPLTPPGTAASARADSAMGRGGQYTPGLYLDGTAPGDTTSAYRLELYGEDSEEHVWPGGVSSGVSAPGQGAQAAPGLGSVSSSRPISAHSTASAAPAPVPPHGGMSYYRAADTDGLTPLFGRLSDAHASGGGGGAGSRPSSFSSRTAAGSHLAQGTSSGAAPGGNTMTTYMTNNMTTGATAHTQPTTTTTTGASAPAPFRACRPVSACSVPLSCAAAGSERRAVGPQQAVTQHSDMLAHPTYPYPAGTQQPHHSGAAAGSSHYQPFVGAAAAAAAAAHGRPSTAPHAHAARELHAQTTAIAGSSIAAAAAAAAAHQLQHQHHTSHYHYQHQQHPAARQQQQQQPGAHTSAPFPGPSATHPGVTIPRRPSSASARVAPGSSALGSATYAKFHISPAVQESLILMGPASAAPCGAHAQQPHPPTGGWGAGRTGTPVSAGHTAVAGGAGGGSGAASLRNKLQPSGGEPPLPQPGAASAGNGFASAAAPGSGGGGTATDVPPSAASAAVAAAGGAVAGTPAAAGATPGIARAGPQQGAGATGPTGAASGAAMTPSPQLQAQAQVQVQTSAGSGSIVLRIQPQQPSGSQASNRWLDPSGGGWDWSTGVYLTGGPLMGHNLGAKRGAEGARAQSAGAGAGARSRPTVAAGGRMARAATARTGSGAASQGRAYSSTQRGSTQLQSSPVGAAHSAAQPPFYLSPATAMFASQGSKQQQQQQQLLGHPSAPLSFGAQYSPYVLDARDSSAPQSTAQSAIMTTHRGLSLSRRGAPGDAKAAGSATGAMPGGAAGHATSRASYGGPGSPSAAAAAAAASTGGVGSGAGSGAGSGGKAVSLSRTGSGNVAAGAGVAGAGTAGAAGGMPGAGPVGASLFFSHFASRPESPNPSSKPPSLSSAAPMLSPAVTNSSGGGAGGSGDASGPATPAPKPPVVPRPSTSHPYESPDKRRGGQPVAPEYASMLGGAVLTVTGRKLQQQG